MSISKKVYLITSNAEAGTLETMPTLSNVELISNESFLHFKQHFSKNQKICITSEASIELVSSRLDERRRSAIKVLKDKFEFRQLLNSIYPNYNFSVIKVKDITNLRISEKSVIKPVKGCFGTAVKVIEPGVDLDLLKLELTSEITKNGSILSDSVLSKEDFIIEQYIEGEEYAIDMFYNDEGIPCIVNIYHHPMPKNRAYLHMIYYSSKSVFEDVYIKVRFFFTELNKLLKVTNFVMHCEFKVKDGVIIPIEINPMRFGGMGLGNLVFYSLGINPYTYYLEGKEPDWKIIWQSNDQNIYAFFIAYNALNKPIDKYKPNISRLKQNFSKVLLERHFNYQKQLAFGIFCLKETEENLLRLLEIEFDDFFDEI